MVLTQKKTSAFVVSGAAMVAFCGLFAKNTYLDALILKK